MAQNKNLTKVALYYFDDDKKEFVPFAVDIVDSGKLVVTSYNRNTLYTGTVTITSAGTAVQGPNVQVPAEFAVAVVARPTNTGNCFLGMSQLDAQTSGNRVTLQKGGPALEIRVTNVNLLWFDAANNNDVVEIVVER